MLNVSSDPTRKLVVWQYRQHAVVDRRDKVICRNGDDSEGALPCAGQGVAPVFLYAGDAEHLAVAARNCVTFPAGVFLKDAVHRHYAAAPSVSVPEHPLLRNCLGARMDGLQIRPPVRIVRDQTPTKPPLDGQPGLRMAAEHKLQPRRLGPFISEMRHRLHSLAQAV
jgi:hypothetical protein